MHKLDRAVATAGDIWQERRPFTQIGTMLPGLITEVRATIPLADGAPGRLSIYGSLHLLRAIQFARFGDEPGAVSALDTADKVAAK